jgi:succinate dehydrogenase flavin-adding protein (antitoxin of CptAB toxin-antitoxin module)
MKKYIFAILSAVTLLGCADTKKQEKLLLDSVIAVHDKVMGSTEHLMKNKMILDSLIKHDSTTINADSAKVYLKLVDDADNAMSDWMHKFDAENKGKSHQEIMDYLTDQKKKIIVIDSQINTAVNSSNKYLTTTTKK